MLLLDVQFPNASVTSLLNEEKYYGYDATTHPENMERLGTLIRKPLPESSTTCCDRFYETYFYPCNCYSLCPVPKPSSKIFEEPSTLRARENRIQAFQSAANEIIKIVPSDLTTHVIEDIIDSDEDQVIASISATEVENFPATTDTVRLRGSIEIAIVQSKLGNKPYLIFSVNQGTVSIRISEYFLFIETLCCSLPCGEGVGNFGSLFHAKSVISNQFYVLELDTIVDCYAYRELARSVKATTGSIEKPCYLYCINCTACFAAVCMCTSCPCCQGSRLFHDAFEAEDSYVLGTDPPLNSSTQFQSNAVNWNLETDGNQFNNISFYYKSQDNTVRECKLKLAFNQTFDDAKRFVILMRSLF